MNGSSTTKTDSELDALKELVREIVRAPGPVEVRGEAIKSRVVRLRCTTNGRTRSFVGKRLDPYIARRNELVARRWLPAVGLGDHGPPLLAVVAEGDGSSSWHLYEDLGDSGLDPRNANADRVATAVAAIARIHTRFAEHALIPEFRLWGGDLGIRFYGSSVGDAIRALEWAQTREQRLEGRQGAVCDRLHARLLRLLDEHGARGEALARLGGPETLLHGDLWPMNVMVVAGGETRWVRFIDWDHAAVGPASYDVSTFLSRFPPARRAPILRLYEEEVGRAGWRLPSTKELNYLFETAELARIANRVIWPALAAWEGNVSWAFDALEEVERWFERLAPLLPRHETCG